ncbi:MAG: hypothetical protein LBR82_03825 [Desulfovibrio sp.]|nr:hypothetical protein [Desulfovibrio sp.]
MNAAEGTAPLPGRVYRLAAGNSNYGFFSRTGAACQTFHPMKNQEFSSTYLLDDVSLNAIIRIAARLRRQKLSETRYRIGKSLAP